MPFPNHVEAFLARRQALVERTNAQLLRMQARRDALEAAGQALLAWREWLAQYDPRVEE